MARVDKKEHSAHKPNEWISRANRFEEESKILRRSFKRRRKSFSTEISSDPSIRKSISHRLIGLSPEVDQVAHADQDIEILGKAKSRGLCSRLRAIQMHERCCLPQHQQSHEAGSRRPRR